MKAIDQNETLNDALERRGPGLHGACATSQECVALIAREVKTLIELCIHLADVLIYDGRHYPVDENIFFVVKPVADPHDPNNGHIVIEVTNEMPQGLGRKLIQGDSPIWFESLG